MILIDPGHGGKDPGAVYGQRESDIVLAIGKELASLLAATGRTSALTRDSDMHLHVNKSLDLATRVQRAQYADCLVSLHCNAATNSQAKGIEVFTSKGQDHSDPLAEYVIKSLMAAFPLRKFRINQTDGDLDKEADFYVLRKSPCPAILVELGFLSNEEEGAWLGNRAVQLHLAMALCAGIMTRYMLPGIFNSPQTGV